MITIKNEALSPEKEAFIILDKLAEDLKKIYDQEDYEVYEEQRINEAGEDLIELGASHPMIKELVAFVSNAVYDRVYTSDDLKNKITEVVRKYSNK